MREKILGGRTIALAQRVVWSRNRVLRAMDRMKNSALVGDIGKRVY